MGIVNEKLNALNIDNKSKCVLSACIDPDHSVLNSSSCEELFRTLTKDIKSGDDNMLSFLMSLVDEPDDRYIKLPHYINTGKRKLKDNEMVLDEYGKYGILLNVISNRKTFNFSVRLKDMTIVKYNYELRKQERGNYRSFRLTDSHGNISNNWKTLKVFQMHEKKQIFDNHKKHDIKYYNTFVDASLANKIFDIKYFLLRCYINRLVFERDYWKTLKDSAIERLKHDDLEYEYKKFKEEYVDDLEESENDFG